MFSDERIALGSMQSEINYKDNNTSSLTTRVSTYSTCSDKNLHSSNNIYNDNHYENDECYDLKSHEKTSRNRSSIKKGLNIFKRNKKTKKKSKNKLITSNSVDIEQYHQKNDNQSNNTSNKSENSLTSEIIDINNSGGTTSEDNDINTSSNVCSNDSDDDDDNLTNSSNNHCDNNLLENLTDPGSLNNSPFTHNKKESDNIDNATIIHQVSSDSSDLSGECDCSYLSNHITQELLDIDYDELFDDLFSPSSEVNKEFIKNKKLSKYCSEDTPGKSKNEFSRKTTYTIPLQWCGKTIDTTAIYYVTRKKGHIKVFCESVAKGMPYGNAFITNVHYCIKSLGDRCCVVNVSFLIKYTQNVWAVTRKIIDKEVKYNVNEFVLLLIQLVKSKISKKPPLSSPTTDNNVSKIQHHGSSDLISHKTHKDSNDLNLSRKAKSLCEVKSESIPTQYSENNQSTPVEITETNDHNKLTNNILPITTTQSMDFSDIIKERSSIIIMATDLLSKGVDTILNIDTSHAISFCILICLLLIFNALNNINSNFQNLVTAYIENIAQQKVIYINNASSFKMAPNV